MFKPTEVRALVSRLRAADPKCSVLGTIGHRYEFRAPIEERTLFAWEHEHGIQLPDDYRAYLLELGNGGAGPDYGIWPLGMWDGPGKLQSFDDSVGDLRAAFPHREAWNLPAARLEIPDFDDDDPDAEDAWHSALDEEYYEPSLMDGSFWISEQGCALRTLLVVSGSERGTMWNDYRPDHEGLIPIVRDGRHQSFGDWYLAWLDESLRSITR